MAEQLAWSCVIASADTESSVTKMASFLVVPASRSECASTRAPVDRISKSQAGHFVQLACQTYQEDTHLSEEAISALDLAFGDDRELGRGLAASGASAHCKQRAAGIPAEVALTLAYTSSPPCAAMVRKGPSLATSNREEAKQRRKSRQQRCLG